jgi:hypothetical protein
MKPCIHGPSAEQRDEAGFPVPPAEVNMSVLVRALTYAALFIACRAAAASDPTPKQEVPKVVASQDFNSQRTKDLRHAFKPSRRPRFENDMAFVLLEG